MSIPVFVSSGPWAWRAPWKWFIDWHLISGCVAKTTTLKCHSGNGPLWRTVRPYQGGWINRMGLPNSGLADARVIYMTALSKRLPEKLVLSVAAPDGSAPLFAHLQELHTLCPIVKTFELNLSCPSACLRFDTISVDELVGMREHKMLSHFRFILKIAADTPTAMIEAGVRNGMWIHAGNSVQKRINGQIWGLSGTPEVLEENLKLVKQIRHEFPDVFIIAGGGIQSIQDGEKYANAGANALSVGSVLLKRPWAANRIALAFS